VTGTNGKTTTAFLLDAMLNSANRKTVLVGTIENHVAGAVRPAPHTTPESRDLLELLREGVDAGATEAVMEVSSHALAQGRVYGLPYDVAIFHEPDAGSPRLSRNDGELLRGEAGAVRWGAGRGAAGGCDQY
jgi:UDP-N-acetylmuramyl tripeptide synthase